MPQSLTVKLDLYEAADFIVSVPDRRITVVAGTTASYGVSAERLSGYSGDVNLTTYGTPAGSTATFNDDELSVGESATLSIGTSGVSAGTYEFTILGAPPPYESIGYWVSPTGTSTWANAYNITPLSGTSCCSLATANANASAGDAVYLRGGTYVTNICPANSGTSGARIIYQAYGSETPLFTVDEAGGRWAIKLQGASWIRVNGIDSYQSSCFFRIGYGSCYNEILNCNFDTSSFDYSLGVITWLSSAGYEGGGSNHNWIHHNTFSRYGGATDCSDLGTIRISANGNDPTCNNMFEDNVFFYGGHDLLDIGGRYNVARNNVFHNDESYFPDTTGTCVNSPVSGYFANRCLILSNSGDYLGTAYHTLIEGNRIGYAGTPCDDDGACNIENSGCHTIVRGNYVYGSQGPGIYSKAQPAPVPGIVLKSGSWSRYYQNTVYHSGSSWTDGSTEPDLMAWIKCGFVVAGISEPDYYPWPVDVVFKNSINYWWITLEHDFTYASSEGQITYENNYNLDPSFVNPSLADRMSLVLPDLRIQTGSPCINGGSELTLAAGAGNNSTALTVDDAYYFQDGTWGSSLSDMRADWIAIGTVGNVVQISSINYDTKVITLASPMTWADNAPIWLYKNSSGERVLYGTAPNQGADQVTK